VGGASFLLIGFVIEKGVWFAVNKKDENRLFLDNLVGFFRSLKLTIFLLIVLAITSIAGTVIQQQASAQEYISEYGESGYRIIKALMLNDMYHSWWFLILLGLLIVNIVVCSLDRLPRSWRFLTHPEKWPEKGKLNQYVQKAKWRSPFDGLGFSSTVKTKSARNSPAFQPGACSG